MSHGPVTFSRKISWPLQLISVSHLNFDYRSISGWVIFTEIFKALRSVNSNIHK